MASLHEINLLKEKAKKLIEKFKPYYKRSVVGERYFYFDPNMLKIPDNAYVKGYWQSEKYFNNIKDLIKKEFTLKQCFDNVIEKDLIKKIKNVDSASLHIRRGDYATHKKTKRIHGLCGLDYYYRAVKKMKNLYPDVEFFIFSDDIQWAEKNLKIGSKAHFISGNYKLKDYQELILLSKCNHHIIANSTFSWWGAWLSDNKDKKVFVPRRWFAINKYNTKDLIPSDWFKI
ncbi:MAG: alpha-1,2-fucosyltransferase [Candidatus Portnoybacteria bacterium]|nr:alpha-1,2-fucosyltransferase [Candidatus Portnoybacteria bacterium]